MGASYFSSNGASVDHPPTSRSLWSRLSLPIRNRARNIADFHIIPKEPHRQYTAGDRVHGAVHLTVVKPVRITHLTVTLHGFVRVHKGPAVAERELATPVLNGRADAQYHGNGYASLFQDEVVLAGEGRLDAAKYQFQFDLQLPKTGLPSSIDFERGTISYMITATLTRPTGIAPTTTCERKISLVEKLDVGTLQPPRPRTIYVEPISKRRKRKQGAAPTTPGAERPPHTADAHDRVSVSDSALDQSKTSEELQQEGLDNPRSPVQNDVRSEISDDSGLTTSSNMSDRGTEFRVAHSLTTNAKLQAVDEKTITATIELLRGGAVAGDMATVKVAVQHIKRLKSMHGVIVTLYRQGRIDTAPPALLFTDMMSKDDARRLQKEEYYPRSRTGLGGLSLSSATSLSVFRKDLSQTIAPLIIDPATLETTVTASVKVPEDAFPTINNVPGDMVSFKYQIEVVVDLGGRLSSHLSSGTQSRSGGFSQGGSAPTDSGNYMSRGSSVLPTDRLRREKGVISVNFELMMGTEDSMRGRARSNTLRMYQMHEAAVTPDDIVSPWSEDGNGAEDAFSHWSPPTPTRGGPPSGPLGRRLTNGTTHHPPQLEEEEEAPAYVAPPQITDESALTDKERALRHEQRLLPSQPPAAPEAGPSAGAPTDATAPTAESETNIYDAEDTVPSAPEPALPSGSAVPGETASHGAFDEHAPSAPTLDDLAAAGSNGEDKLEAERRRLLNEASAPPEFPDDYEAGPSRPSAPPVGTEVEPSAPVLSDEDDYGGQYSYRQEAGGSSSGRQIGAVPEPLPAYER